MHTNGKHDVDIIQTTDEEGQVHVFEKVDTFEIEDQEYALLIYKGSGEEWENGKAPQKEPSAEEKEKDEEGYDEEVIVMKILQEDGEEVFAEIEDQTEYDNVVKHLEELQDEDIEIELSEVLSLIDDLDDAETNN